MKRQIVEARTAMLKRVVIVTVAVTLLVLCSTNMRADSFGIQGSASISTMLPTTTLGGGGSYSQQVIVGTANSPLQQTNYNLVPPLSFSDSVTGGDPSSGALYTANAAAAVNTLSVNDGTLHLWVTSQGGTLDPNIFNDVGGNAFAQIYWADYLAFAGANLAPGAPVLVQVSTTLDASLSASGDVTYPNNALDYNLNFATNLSSGLVDCGNSAAVSAVSQAYIYPANQGGVNINPSFLVCVPSNTLVLLSYSLIGGAGGGGQWTGTVNASDTAATYINVLTPGVTLTSLSGLTYTSPTSVPEPSTLGLFGSGLTILVGAVLRKRLC